jgi:hypothetical protein
MAMNALIQKLKAFWASLPHAVQALVVLFVTTAGTTIAHSIEDGIVPHTWADAKHMLGTAVVAGIVAVRAFYMLPNGNAQLVAQAKAENASQLPPDVPKS